MAEVRPFRAVRYDFTRFHSDLSAVVAPPYDVLNAQDKAALLARSPNNIVAVDLPHYPPKDEGPEQAYTDALFSLDSWLAEGTLVREKVPALYAYNQTFSYNGHKHTRHQVIGALRLHEFSEGVVLPHEQTFGGPKADRLALTKATRCNMSPVFGLYTDPDQVVNRVLGKATTGPADATADLEGVHNEVWIITDASIIGEIGARLAGRKVFIADGHHRYSTALNYRNHVAALLGDSFADDHPASFVMVVLAGMEDPGCVIQGYNRVLEGPGLTLAGLGQAWAAGVAECAAGEANLLACDGATGAQMPWRFTNRAVLDTLAPERKPAWRQLDIAYLHSYLLDRLAAAKFGGGLHVHYVKSVEDARALAAEKKGVALLPKPTPMAHLRAVSEAGELMPQKSTYFYPKLATGLAINPLYAEQ